MPIPVSRRLIEFLRTNFQLDWHGIHGVSHWARVKQNGLLLARETGADPQVVTLFAFLHDAERIDDFADPEHGVRAARLAFDLNGDLYRLSAQRLDLLRKACEGHSDGLIEADITIQTCWDADRLDLGRIGIRPDPGLLCTAAAKAPDMIEWCYLRAFNQPCQES